MTKTFLKKSLARELGYAPKKLVPGVKTQVRKFKRGKETLYLVVASVKDGGLYLTISGLYNETKRKWVKKSKKPVMFPMNAVVNNQGGPSAKYAASYLERNLGRAMRINPENVDWSVKDLEGGGRTPKTWSNKSLIRGDRDEESYKKPNSIKESDLADFLPENELAALHMRKRKEEWKKKSDDLASETAGNLLRNFTSKMFGRSRGF